MKVQGLVRKCIRIRILFGLIVAGSVVLVALKTFSADEDGTGETNRSAETVDAAEPNKAPMIIWYHHVYKDRPIALRTALSSGLITHAMVKDMHRKDIHHKKEADVLEAVKITKSFGVKLIWSRPLWPLHGVEDSSAEDLFDPDYYIREIDVLRAEGQALGADFVALDAESYAHAPVNKYLRGRNKLSTKQREQLEAAIDKTISAVGKVDFVYPGGAIYSRHPANILGKLGRFRTSNLNYYKNEKRRRQMTYCYQIAGFHVNIIRENKRHPKLPYYFVSELFENSHLWSNKKGLFIYPHDHKSLAIAKELVAYSRKLPFKASQQQKRPDSVPK